MLICRIFYVRLLDITMIIFNKFMILLLTCLLFFILMARVRIKTIKCVITEIITFRLRGLKLVTLQ